MDRGISPILAGMLGWLKPDAGVVGACLGPLNWECRLLPASSWSEWSDYWAGTNPSRAVWDRSCQSDMADSPREEWDYNESDKSRG